MKPIVYITLLLLCGFLNSHAQTDNLFANLPQKEREEFYENACFYIQNTYYYQLAEAIANPACHEALIGYLMIGDYARYQPELTLQTDTRFLTPTQYLKHISQHFDRDESENLEFIVDNFSFNDSIISYPENPLTCFIQVEYDLEVRLRETSLLKRRCRMCCLFPQPLVKANVKTMQVEPIKDIYIASESPSPTASDKARLKEALEWYEQGQTEKSVPVFKELAEKGMTEAEFQYGLCLYKEYRLKDAIYWFIKAADKGHANALSYLGTCYQYGKGVQKNDRKATEYYQKAAKEFRKAAERGDANAQFNLGECYSLGLGVSKNDVEATEWYAKAAEQGHARAQCYLGECYFYGKGKPKDEKKAIEWYSKAAKQGDGLAQSALERIQIMKAIQRSKNSLQKQER